MIRECPPRVVCYLLFLPEGGTFGELGGAGGGQLQIDKGKPRSRPCILSWETIQVLVVCFLPGHLCKDNSMTNLDKYFACSSITECSQCTAHYGNFCRQYESAIH